MSKEPQTAQTVQKTELPQYAQDAQQNLIALGKQLTSGLTSTPQFAVAGLNPDQLYSGQAFRNLLTNEVENYRGPTGQAGVTSASAASLDPASILKFQNPFTSQVIDTTADALRRNYNKSDADMAAKYAAGGAYGGSREAVARSMNSKNFGDTLAQTIAQLRSQGFDKASALASQDTANQQATGLANAAAANSMSNNNASREMQQNNDWWTHALQAITGMNNFGNQVQTTQQAAVDAPFKALGYATSTTPSLNNTGGTTTTDQPVQDNTLSSILGIGMLGAKLFGLSDENEKTNIQPLGKDPKTGLKISAYDYKSDVDAAKKSGSPMPPKRVGPMAQDISKIFPNLVSNVGGKKVVDFGALAKLMEAA